MSSLLVLSTDLCRWAAGTTVLTLQVSRLWLRFINIPKDIKMSLCLSYFNTNASFSLFCTENILSSVLNQFQSATIPQGRRFNGENRIIPFQNALKMPMASC